MTNYKDVKYRSLVAGDIPNLAASKTTSGTFADGRLSESSVTQHVTEYDDNPVQSNIALLGFKTAVNGSLAKYNLVDQIIDEYADASGVDTGASTNETLSSGAYSGAVSSDNYFGSSTTDNTTSGAVSVTTSNTNGSYDADMAVVEYDDWTIGHTVTTDQPCRGMLVLIKGDLTINSGGDLSMTGRGASADPTASGGGDSNAVASAGLQFAMETSGGSSSFTNDGTGYNGSGTLSRAALANMPNRSSDGTIFTIARAGAAGGARRTGGSGNAGSNAGSSGSTGQSGGGGSGGLYNNTDHSGAGGAGTCFSGGTGGGGGQDSSGTDGAANGGSGGAGGISGAGGAGNPGGTSNTDAGNNGTGGTLVIIVKGDITVNSGGSITANGIGGGGGNESGGGASGGGNIIICHGGTYTNNGTVEAAGGVSESAGRSDGGVGGAGSVQVTQVSADSYNNVTLQSLANTASATATKANMVMLMENNAGTATLNTDIKGYVSANGGSNWTEGTLVDEGTWGTNKKILAFHDLTLSHSGTDMRYKITTHNQSVSKVTKVHATSIGWL